MSNTTLHWELRRYILELRDEGRLAVLLVYILHANVRGRAWPGIELLMHETGWSRAPVVSAKQWHIAHGALKKVPYDKWVGKEAFLHQRTDVMEVTGVIEIRGQIVPYLYFNQQTNEAVNSSASKSLPTKSLLAEQEDTTNSKGIASDEGSATLPTESASTHTEFKNALVKGIHNLTYGEDNIPPEVWGPFERLAKWFRGEMPKSDLQPPPGVTPEKIVAFYQWWRKNNPDMPPSKYPTSHEAIIRQWANWAVEAQKKQQRREVVRDTASREPEQTPEQLEASADRLDEIKAQRGAAATTEAERES